MDLCRIAYGICLIYQLVILLGIHQIGASTGTHNQTDLHSVPKMANILRLHSVDAHSNSPSHSHMMNHIDPSTVVFFLPHELKLGKTMPIYFPNRDPSSSSTHSLSKEEADNIPFTLQQLRNLLQLFSFSPGSPQAIAMEETLIECKRDPLEGETKFCATSYESMLSFAREILGSETNIELLSTVHRTRFTAGIREYTIIRVPQQISAPKMVSCHTKPYPYTVYYCHYQVNNSRVYRISLSGENGERIEAIAVCHMDTTQWSLNHVSFGVLGIEPGSSPVCHFFPADHFVLVASTSAM